MKKIVYFFIFILSVMDLYSQDYSNPLDYLKFINDRQSEILEAVWNYTRTSAHSRRDSKIQKQKQKLIQTIQNAKRDISAMPPLNGKSDLRDSMVNYLNFLLGFINGDLTQLEALELESKLSFTAMLKFLKKQDEVSEKLRDKSDRISAIFNSVAAENNINIQSQETELSKKIKLANYANAYHNKFFLIYFRNILTMNKIIEALNNNDRESYHAWKDTLQISLQWSDKRLSNLGGYNNDLTLKKALYSVIKNIKEINSVQLPRIDAFYRAEEELKKQQLIVNSKPQDQLTQAEVDAYNNAVNRYNTAAENYNDALKQINKLMSEAMETWDKASFKFLDKNVPK